MPEEIETIKAVCTTGEILTLLDLGFVLGVRGWFERGGPRLCGLGAGIGSNWEGQEATNVLLGCPDYVGNEDYSGYHHYYLRGAPSANFYIGDLDAKYVGISASWGWVEFHEHGYRSQFAWPVAIHNIGTSGPDWAVAQHYGCLLFNNGPALRNVIKELETFA